MHTLLLLALLAGTAIGQAPVIAAPRATGRFEWYLMPFSVSFSSSVNTLDSSGVTITASFGPPPTVYSVSGSGASYTITLQASSACRYTVQLISGAATYTATSTPTEASNSAFGFFSPEISVAGWAVNDTDYSDYSFIQTPQAQLFGRGGNSYNTTKTANEYIIIDASFPVVISRVTVTLSGLATDVAHMSLQASTTDDPSSFATITNGDLTLSNHFRPQNFAGFTAQSRYWRLFLTDNFGSSAGLSLANITLHTLDPPTTSKLRPCSF